MGTFVRQDSVTPDNARLTVLTNVENTGDKDVKAELTTSVVDADGKVVASVASPVELSRNARWRWRSLLTWFPRRYGR